MCGIVALAGTRSASEHVASAIERLRHRGPDAHGTWLDEKAGVALGHTRLSIIDLSEAGNQPMISSDGSLIIAFNGEVYNYVEIRSELEDYPFRSRSDTEVVLAAWARWGAHCLDKLIGMFAFVLWDVVEQRLVAVRDRFGVKPLFFSELPGGGIAFASEIKALHAVGVPPSIDDVSWGTY